MTFRGHCSALFCAVSITAVSIASAAAQQEVGNRNDIMLSETEAVTEANPVNLRLAQRGGVADTVRAFVLQQNQSSATADSLALTQTFDGPAGKSFAKFEQRIGGKRVFGAFVKAAFSEDGAMIHVTQRLANASNKIARPSLGDREALQIALELNFKEAGAPKEMLRRGVMAEFAKTDFFHRDPSVERVLISAGEKLEEGFLVETWSEKDNLLYHTLVDGLGRVVSNELRTAQDAYGIFPDHPGNTAQVGRAGPGSGNAQSPSGWLSGTQTTLNIRGNNARAYLDVNGNNVPDGGGRSVTDGNFLTAANLSQAPTTTQNREVAVQNLFYWNNAIHDELYRHGFVEGAGNFQENNFGRGGAGSDSVNAEAQDGSGVNNANFATPGDGSNPRMQMFLWNLTNPQRDGDLDSDIIWHEYGHGLTWRMIGSMSGNVSGAIGEGMSDVLAIVMNNDDRVGEYSAARSTGIRSSRYSQHQDTIGDFNSGRGVHRNGEIIAATMWDLWQAYQGAGLSRDTYLDDVVGGMNFIAPGPDYFDMRDGFLAQAASSRDCIIWEAFAARGMGSGGSMNSTGSSINESFSVPSACGGGNPDPDPDPQAGPELVNLTATARRTSRSRYSATVTVTVGNGNGGPGAGVVASITATGNSVNASGSCTTNSNGQCSATLSNIRRSRTPSVTFTITALNGDPNATGVPASVRVNRR